jgi:hypothetical protein
LLLLLTLCFFADTLTIDIELDAAFWYNASSTKELPNEEVLSNLPSRISDLLSTSLISFSYTRNRSSHTTPRPPTLRISVRISARSSEDFSRVCAVRSTHRVTPQNLSRNPPRSAFSLFHFFNTGYILRLLVYLICDLSPLRL